jgi:hypothetical protein
MQFSALFSQMKQLRCHPSFWKAFLGDLPLSILELLLELSIAWVKILHTILGNSLGGCISVSLYFTAQMACNNEYQQVMTHILNKMNI